MEPGERAALQAIAREALQACLAQYGSLRRGEPGGPGRHGLTEDACAALADNATAPLFVRVGAISTDPVVALEVVIGELFRTVLVLQDAYSDQKTLRDEHPK